MAVPTAPTRTRTLPAPPLGVELPVRVWAAPDLPRGEPAPLLVVHDGAAYAREGRLLRLLGQAVRAGELPPLRAALLDTPRRDAHYSGSALYARALAAHVLPELRRVAPTPAEPRMRVGLGASLGALSLLHAQGRYPDLAGGLFLQSGSFFRPSVDRQEAAFPFFRRITRFTATLGRRAGVRPVPVAMTCASAEENAANNRLAHGALLAEGYPAQLHEHAGGHDYPSWRRALDRHLTAFLSRLWS